MVTGRVYKTAGSLPRLQKIPKGFILPFKTINTISGLLS